MTRMSSYRSLPRDSVAPAASVLQVSIVVPLYNEAENVKPLHRAICNVLESEKITFELIFVDDGSIDGTSQLLECLHQQDSRVRVLRLRRNAGQTIALHAGIQYAIGDAVVTLDGDLQNDPRDIPDLIARLNTGCDLVSGWRKNRNDPYFTRVLPSKIANWLISRFLGTRVHDLGCMLKAYRRELIQQVPLYSDLHRFLPVIAAMATARIDEIVVQHHPRRAGKSKYGLTRVGKVILDILTVRILVSSARRPLHYFGKWSLAAAVLSCVVGIGAAYGAVHADSQSTFVLPGVSILLGSLSIHLLFAGLLGEFVSRTELRDRVIPLGDLLEVKKTASTTTAEA